MKTCRLFFCVVLYFVCAAALAEIKPTKSMADAISSVDSATLLILDLDNTLIAPTQTLGSDQWFDHSVRVRIETLVNEGRSVKEATPLAIDETIVKWVAIQKVTKVKPVESNTSELVASKQKDGVTVLGLTARPFSLNDTTNAQLKSVNIDLNVTPIHSTPVVLEKDSAEFNRGILFVGPHHDKGTMLISLLTKLDYTPKRIVFVDDKAKHVQNVGKALAASPFVGVPYVGYRYGAADETVDAFDPQIADLQLRFFGGILDDESAAVLLP